MITRQAVPAAILAILLSWAVPPTGRLEADDMRAFAEMPIEAHLLIADGMLARQITEAELQDDTVKASRLREARALLTDARRRYDSSRADGTGDDSPGIVLPALESPLSLLQHLWLGADAVAQLRSRILFGDQPFAGSRSEMDTLLDKVIMQLEKAIKEVEAESQWIVHWLYEQRMMVSLPAEYTWSQPLESDLLRLMRKDSQGETTGLFFLSRVTPADEGVDIDAASYRNERIATLRARFPDLQIVELGEIDAEADAFTTSFSYRYTWEGETIHAMVHLHAVSDAVYELNCVSPAALFDQQEADRIIASLLHTVTKRPGDPTNPSPQAENRSTALKAPQLRPSE